MERFALVWRPPADVSPGDASPAVPPIVSISDDELGDPGFRAMDDGVAAARRGEFRTATELFQQAVEMDHDNADAWNNLGVALSRLGSTWDATRALRTALNLDPDHAEAHRNLGVLLDRLGRPKEAARHYEAFLALSAEAHPDRVVVRQRIAHVTRATAR